MTAHAPAIKAQLENTLHELPSVFSYFNSMLQDHERLSADEAYPQPPKIVSDASSAHGKAPSSAQAAATAPDCAALVSFSVTCDSTTPSEAIAIIGGIPELGNWVTGVQMCPANWPLWKLQVPMQELYTEQVEYKYVRLNKETNEITQWEPTENRCPLVWPPSYALSELLCANMLVCSTGDTSAFTCPALLDFLTSRSRTDLYPWMTGISALRGQILL